MVKLYLLPLRTLCDRTPQFLHLHAHIDLFSLSLFFVLKIKTLFMYSIRKMLYMFLVDCKMARCARIFAQHTQFSRVETTRRIAIATLNLHISLGVYYIHSVLLILETRQHSSFMSLPLFLNKKYSQMTEKKPNFLHMLELRLFFTPLLSLTS